MFEFVDVKYKNILDVPELQIEKEKITTLIGSSGSGKTTLLKMLNKLISPTEGKILYNGTDLHSIDSVLHRREVLMLTQNPAIFEGSIKDNLNAGLVFQGKKLIPDTILKQTLEQVKLNKDLDTSANTLSGGEKQRLALGRILVLNPCIFLLDEPSSALDDETEDVLIQMLIEYVQKSRKTIIMVTHSKAVAQKYSDVIIEISEGKIKGRLDYGRDN
jgi:putative ABC transport system ATP-binding protein